MHVSSTKNSPGTFSGSRRSISATSTLEFPPQAFFESGRFPEGTSGVARGLAQERQLSREPPAMTAHHQVQPDSRACPPRGEREFVRRDQRRVLFAPEHQR